MEAGVSAALAPVDPLAALEGAALADWRARLEAAAYRPGVIGACESLLPFPVEPMRLPLIHRMLERRADPASLLARLWSYDGEVEEGALEGVLGGGLCAALFDAGMLERRGGGVHARFRVMPFEDLWLIADRPDAGADAVMGPGGTTGETARLLPPRIAGDVLDLGCGAGSLALLAARRGARRVWGTDLNQRAVAMSRVNARLNQLDAEFLPGDLFAPLAGRRFDRIVSQPPYVIRPPGTPHVTYLHGGAAGDAISSRLLRETPAHLNDGGLALVLLDVPLAGGARIHDRFREIVGDPSVDLCAIVANGFTPAVQAAVYAMIEDPSLGERYGVAARRYRDHLEETGVREFRHVALVLRRPGGSAPRDAVTSLLPVHSMPREDGRNVDDVMAALELAASDEAALLASAVTPSRWARFVQERSRPVLEEEPDYRVLFNPGGIAVDQELSAASVLLLEKLGAAPDVAAAATAYAAAIDEPPDAMRRAVAEFTRRGLGSGLLVPRGPAA